RPFAEILGKRRATLHLSIHLQFGRAFANQAQRCPHLLSALGIARAEVRMADQRRLRNDTESLDFPSCEVRDLGDFLCGRIVVDEGVREEDRAPLRDEKAEAREGADALALADNL